jgi:hypothetical protein
VLSNGNVTAYVRPAVLRLTWCLMARVCISAVSCPRAILLPNGNGHVRVRPAVLRLPFHVMVTGLYDYDRISVG